MRRQRYVRAAWTGVALRCVNIGAQVIALGMTVRYLKNERYGMWATISTFVAWFSMGNVGLGHGLTSRLSAALGKDDREGANRLINSALAIISGISLVLLFGAILAGWLIPWARIFNVTGPMAVAEARPVVMVGMIMTVAILPLSVAFNVLMGYQRADVSNIITLAMTLVGLTMLLIAIAAKANLPILAAVILFPSFAAAVVQFWWAHSRGMIRISWHSVNREDAKSLLSLGFQFLLVQAAGIVVFETGALIIAQGFGAAEVTPYAVTSRMAMVIVSLVAVVLAPLWPAYGEAFARGDLEWVRRIFLKTIRAVLLVWTPSAITLIIFGRKIIGIWAGSGAVPDQTLLVAMVLFTLAHAMASVVAFPLNGIGKLSSQVVGTIAIALLHIPLALYLCRRTGSSGVAISQTALMFLVTNPLAYAHFLRLIRPRGESNSTPPTRELSQPHNA